MGIRVEETSSMHSHRSVGVRLGYGCEFEACQFADSIHLEGAEALATFTNRIFEGQPAATSNRFGKGRAIHLGTKFPLHHLRSFFSSLLDEQIIPRIFPAHLPPGVYATRRKSGDGDVVFPMNFGDAETIIETAGLGWVSHPDGAPIHTAIQLPKFGLKMVLEQT